MGCQSFGVLRSCCDNRQFDTPPQPSPIVGEGVVRTKLGVGEESRRFELPAFLILCQGNWFNVFRWETVGVWRVGELGFCGLGKF